MRRILVTGGAGFLGSHLCDVLLAAGDHVIALDNYFSGRQENIAHLMGHPQFEVINHDVNSPISLQVDRIFNLACPASPIYYQHDPIKTVTTNVMGAINMLELAKCNNARILQASTSEVYGDPEVHPQTEGYRGNVNPIGPRACYDEGKRCAETLFFDYHREMDIDIKVVRIFNTYGPRMRPDDGRVVSNFIMQALKGEPITVYGQGLQTRSFCYVDNLIDAMVKMMDTDNTVTGPINIGNSSEFTIIDLAQKIIALTGSTSEIIYKDLPIDDPVQRRPNISLAKSLLHWEPTIALDQGLKETVQYFQALTAKVSKMSA